MCLCVYVCAGGVCEPLPFLSVHCTCGAPCNGIELSGFAPSCSLQCSARNEEETKVKQANDSGRGTSLTRVI